MKKRLRVLQFGRYFPPHIGGTENVIYDLAEGLQQRDIDCDVLCCNEAFTYEETKFQRGKIMRTATWLKFGSIAFSPGQIFKLKSIWRNYDVIHVHHPAPMATIALWLINPKCKVVVYWHSDIVRQKLLLLFFNFFQNWLLKKADAVVATTPAYILHSSALLKHPSKTSYIPIGITGFQHAATERFQELQVKYAGKKVIFSLGRLVEYKGFEYLIDAAAHLSDDYIILIGGDGRLKEPLLDRIRVQKLDNRVRLLGRLTDEDVHAHMQLCELFCMSSVTKNEAFGLVLAEAMSLGKPIVATVIPGSGVQWVNEHAVSGINVPIKDGEAIAKAIQEISGNDVSYRNFSANAKSRFEKNFKKERMLDAFVGLYRKLI